MIDSESFSSVKRRFVRDRDFDVFMGMADDAEDIFLTCGYSIENYLIVEEDIRRFIVNTFCESIQGWQSYVDQELEKLFMLIKLLHVRLERLYAFCFSKIGTGEVVNLDTISFRKIIAKYEVSIRDFELYVDQGVASIVDEDFVEEEKFDIFFDKAREYVEGCSEKRVRGKYLLGVLAEFLEHIYEKMKENNLSEQYGKINVRRNAMINFSDRYVFERLSGNFVVPVRFENFLREYLS